MTTGIAMTEIVSMIGHITTITTGLQMKTAPIVSGMERLTAVGNIATIESYTAKTRTLIGTGGTTTIMIAMTATATSIESLL